MESDFEESQRITEEYLDSCVESPEKIQKRKHDSYNSKRYNDPPNAPKKPKVCFNKFTTKLDKMIFNILSSHFSFQGCFETHRPPSYTKPRKNR